MGGEVSVRMLVFYLDLARTAGVDAGELTRGLVSVAPPDAKQADRLDWDDFAEIVDRFERMVGGPEDVGRVMRAALPTAFLDIRAFASVFILPVPLFTFVMNRLMRTNYSNLVYADVEQLGDDCVRWRFTIPEPYRGCEAFHRASVSLMEIFPCHLGLPEAHVEQVTMTPRTAAFVVRFPRPDPIRVRGSRAVSSLAAAVAGQLDEAFAKLSDSLRATPPVVTTAGGYALEWARRLELSPRQRAVFALLVEGRANKEIAAALRCTEGNVEFHVGRIFRAARVTSRSELLAKVLAASPAPPSC